MAYTILRFKKDKGGAIAGCERHNERKKEAYKSNPDIDMNKSKENYHIIHAPQYTYSRKIKELIKEYGCKTRKDSVKLVETLITASPEFMNRLSKGEQREYFERAVKFMKDEIGEDRIISAVVHMDEATPHLHIDFVPYTTGSKRGLDTRVSLKQALMALGFKGGTRQETELNQWVMAEKQQLAAIMLEHGIEWEQKGTHEKHLSLLDFEKKERAKEVSMLEKQKSELEEHNAIMQEVNEKYLDQLERVEKDIFSAQESRKEVDKQAEQAKKKAAQYEKKLTEIAPMVKEMEMFAEKYSADPEEVLPEAGTLETGKSYREKKAKPLIKKIVTVLRSVYRAYLDLSAICKDHMRGRGTRLILLLPV